MENIQVTLSRNDLGQLLDGLQVLIEQWHATAAYHTTGEMDIESDNCIRECTDADEASDIAETYRRLADRLQQQMLAI